MRAVSLHRDVIVVTSQLLQAHCTIVRGPIEVSDEQAASSAGPPRAEGPHGEVAGETFVIDSPVLPEELELLPSLIEQAGFPPANALLSTHGDWDHVLGRIAFPEAALGCAESTASRLSAEPGGIQRELRAFDEELLISRPRPLSLGSIQALAAPGRCGIGDSELELYPAEGHTRDGMALWIPWSQVLVAGDYLSSVEIPTLNGGDTLDDYLATLERLRPLLGLAEHVVPGHGPLLEGLSALEVLEEDSAYLKDLRERGSEAELPAGRRSRAQRAHHAENVLALRT